VANVVGDVRYAPGYYTEWPIFASANSHCAAGHQGHAQASPFQTGFEAGRSSCLRQAL